MVCVSLLVAGWAGLSQAVAQEPAPVAESCLPACLEDLMGRCRATGTCTVTPPPPARPLRTCWQNGTTVTFAYAGATPMASSHTHYTPEGALCFQADSAFDMAAGRVTWTVHPKEGADPVGELEFTVFVPEASARARCTGGAWQDVPLTSPVCEGAVQRPEGCAPGACPEPDAESGAPPGG